MGKRGRKKMMGVKREPNGRRSRALDAQNEHQVAIETRQRLFGLSEQDARDQKAATVLGRLYLTGELGKKPGCDAMWEAAQDLIRLRDAYHRAIKAPDALKNAVGAGGGLEETDSYAIWCRRVIDRYQGCIKAISDENAIHANRGTNLHAAIDYIVFRDANLPHLVGDLRIALNAVSHHLTVGGKSVDKRHIFHGPQVAA